MAKGRWKWPTAGECRVCGCTNEAACLGGCVWVDERGKTARGATSLCSSCSGTKRDLLHALAWVGRLVDLPTTDRRHLGHPRLVAKWAGGRAAARALE